MPTVGIEPTISAGVRPQTYALVRAATLTGYIYICIKTVRLSVSTHVIADCMSMTASCYEALQETV